MTKIMDGFAQPDIEATKGTEKILVFVETPDSLSRNAKELKRTLAYLKAKKPGTQVDLVMTKPRKGE